MRPPLHPPTVFTGLAVIYFDRCSTDSILTEKWKFNSMSDWPEKPTVFLARDPFFDREIGLEIGSTL